MVPKNLTPLDGPTTANADQYSTSSLAPAANSLVLAFVANIRDEGGFANIPTAQSNGAGWTQVATMQVLNAPEKRITCFSKMSPGAGALTFSFAGQRQTDCAWSVFEFEGVDAANAVLQPQTFSGNSQAILHSLGALSNPATSSVAGGIFVTGNPTISPAAGTAEIYDRFLDTRAALQTQHAAGNPAMAWTLSGAADYAAILVEIKATAAAPVQPSSTEALARRFEPILALHPQEKFFPSDARRYVEHAALWNAVAPFDQKTSWTPVIPQHQIAAIGGQPGQFLGNNLLPVGSPDVQFLDPAGWKTAAGAPQPAVTAESKNTYSDRDKIAALYNNADNQGGDAALRDSRFWYHVEFLENERLRQVLGTVQAPDLVKVLDGKKNAALLNYYFFFPAHEEALGDECTNVEAREFACFAGDWACTSILLVRDDPAGAFRPELIGHSGRWLKDEATGTVRPGQVPDDGDPAKRIVMKVSPFASAEKIGEHPKLFVSKGSHSLDLTVGPHNVAYPDDVRSFNCGRTEINKEGEFSKFPEYLPDMLKSMAVFFWKWLSGGLLNLGPLSLVPGFIWALTEREPEHSSERDPADKAQSDETVQPGAPGGKIIRPKSLAVPDAGPDIEDWRSAQGVEAEGRQYDFVVDRLTQIWWPREDIDEQGPGYRGRWGPLVEGDPLGRRSGMKFPPFWRMFFMALAGQQAE